MAEPDFVFRRATAADRDTLNAITQSSSSYAGTYRTILDGYEITPDQIETDEVHVAEQDGRIAGYFSLIVAPEPELDLLFVANEAQGTGVGSALFEYMLAIARRRGLASLKIVSHPPSAGFYERMGAERVGIVTPDGRVTWERPVLSLTVDRR